MRSRRSNQNKLLKEIGLYLVNNKKGSHCNGTPCTTSKLKINPFQEQQPQPSLRPTAEPLQPSLPSSCKTRSSSQSSMGSTSTTSSSKCGRTTKIRRRLRRARTRSRVDQVLLFSWHFFSSFSRVRDWYFQKSHLFFTILSKNLECKFYLIVQRVLALCQFHYCDFPKLSMNIWLMRFYVLFVTAIFG